MQATNEHFMQRMNEVGSKIRAYARFFAFKAPFLDADDLYQEAMLKLYERFSVEPAFLDNNNSYISCYAAWMMKNALNHERNLYAKHVVDMELEYCEVPFLTGYIPRPEPEAVRSEVRDIAKQMPEEYQTVYSAIVEGYEPEEIGAMLGVGKYTVARRKRYLIHMLGWAYSVPKNKREYIIREMHG